MISFSEISGNFTSYIGPNRVVVVGGVSIVYVAPPPPNNEIDNKCSNNSS